MNQSRQKPLFVYGDYQKSRHGFYPGRESPGSAAVEGSPRCLHSKPRTVSLSADSVEFFGASIFPLGSWGGSAHICQNLTCGIAGMARCLCVCISPWTPWPPSASAIHDQGHHTHRQLSQDKLVRMAEPYPTGFNWQCKFDMFGNGSVSGVRE